MWTPNVSERILSGNQSLSGVRRLADLAAISAQEESSGNRARAMSVNRGSAAFDRASVAAENMATVLIIDDSASSREQMRDILSEEYLIWEAADTLSAYKILEERKEEIALILLDADMPGIEGISVLEFMNERGWMLEIPVVLMIEERERRRLERAFSLGISDVVIRPFYPVLVQHRIRSVLKLSHRTAELEERANKDALTGLYNKQEMEQRVQAILADRRVTMRYGMMLVEAVALGDITERFGKSAGDSYLQLVAAQVKKSTRGDDLIGRIGDDTFMIFFFCYNNPEQVVKRIFGRILSVKDEDQVWNKGFHEKVPYAVCAGFATTWEIGRDYKVLKRTAQAALQSAREEGPNSCISNYEQVGQVDILA